MSDSFLPFNQWSPGDDEKDDGGLDGERNSLKEDFLAELELRGIYDGDERAIYMFVEPHWEEIDVLSDEDAPRKIGHSDLFWCEMEGSAAHIMREFLSWLETQDQDQNFLFNFVGAESWVSSVSPGGSVVKSIREIIATWDHPILIRDVKYPETDWHPKL